MTQSAFQGALARLVVDPAFRDLVRSSGAAALEGELTSLEQVRLTAMVDEKGLDATRMLHKSFRLTKLYATLPLTRRLLGPTILAAEVSAFWSANNSDSHYFLNEAIAFCDFLLERARSGLEVEYLDEVVAYERAALNLRRVLFDGETRQAEVIHFRHDATMLFENLIEGKQPGDIPERPCKLTGVVNERGEVEWTVD